MTKPLRPNMQPLGVPQFIKPLPGAGVRVANPDGSFSTERSASVNIDGRERLIPTLVNGNQLSIDSAIQEAAKRGIDNYPNFETPEAAERYAELRTLALGRQYEQPKYPQGSPMVRPSAMLQMIQAKQKPSPKPQGRKR